MWRSRAFPTSRACSSVCRKWNRLQAEHPCSFVNASSPATLAACAARGQRRQIPTGRGTVLEEGRGALRQESTHSVSLLDGHPAAPGDWELQLDSGWLTLPAKSDAVPLTPTVKYTPHRYIREWLRVLRAMQLSLEHAAGDGPGDFDGSGDMTFGWQERWVAEHDGSPRWPRWPRSACPPVGLAGGRRHVHGHRGQGPGAGTSYLNGWVRTAGENNYGLTDNYVPPGRATVGGRGSGRSSGACGWATSIR